MACDFVGGPVNHRLRFGGGQSGLGAGCWTEAGVNPHIVDATAGLGRDAFLLASLGAKVTLIERSPMMYELLKEGMERARAAGGITAQVIARMRLIIGDSIALLPELALKSSSLIPCTPRARNRLW